MNMGELVDSYDELIDSGIKAKSKKWKGSDAVIRQATIYKNVALYLLQKGTLKTTDDASAFNYYINTFTPSTMYRVANAHLHRNEQPQLNYTQDTYHVNPMYRNEGDNHESAHR